MSPLIAIAAIFIEMSSLMPWTVSLFTINKHWQDFYVYVMGILLPLIVLSQANWKFDRFPRDMCSVINIY